MKQLEVKTKTEDDALFVLCSLYWELSGEKEFAHELIDIAALTMKGKDDVWLLAMRFSVAHMPGWSCPKCGHPHYFSSREHFSASEKNLRLKPLFCSSCLDAESKKDDEYEELQVEESKKARSERIANGLREAFPPEKKNELVSPDKFRLIDIAFFLSVTRACGVEEMTKVTALFYADPPLSPSDEMTFKVASSLADNDLIFVDPDSPLEAFSGLDEGNYGEYYPIFAHYLLPRCLDDHGSQPSTTLLVSRLLAIVSESWKAGWEQEALNLWVAVALEECIEYLLFELKAHHLDFSPGTKTRQNIEYALQFFSTGQVLNLIWRSVRNAAAYYQRGGVYKKQAANSAITTLRRQTERALAEEWNLKSYGRSFNYPQSILSEVLYNAILKVGAGGFHLVPKIENIKMDIV
jgi:hypothetical protein